MAEQVRKVREIMTSEVVTIGMDETLEAARSVFNQRRFHHLIVIEGGDFGGRGGRGDFGGGRGDFGGGRGGRGGGRGGRGRDGGGYRG